MNARGQLTKVTFPNGFGETYTYDMLGRRVNKTQFNHQGETQQTTTYHYKGDTWVLIEEVVSGDGNDGESTKSYTYDANDRPLTITFKGQTFWYVYNGHGDVMALTDKDGNVAARYEYDAWGLVTRMYNRYGERVREGIGWIGDLGTGNGSPGSVQGPDGGGNGNTTPDYHPGNGNANGKSSAPDQSSTTTTPTETGSTSPGELTLSDIMTPETEPTADITTELVKENPIRYAGYYWDRKTQFYYLQARYYDPRPARFISEDSYEGEVENPKSLNQYVYVENNPVMYVDPSGHAWIDIVEGFNDAVSEALTLGLSSLWDGGPRKGEEDDYYLGQYIGFQTTGIVSAIAAATSGGAASGGALVCLTGVGCVVGGPVAIAGAIAAGYQAGVGTYAFLHADKALKKYQDNVKTSESTRSNIKDKGLPSNGPLRFIPDKDKGVIVKKQGGKEYYVDRFGNEWRRGPYHGDPSLDFTYEWDVTLSKQGKKVWGKLENTKNGVTYVNIRPDGYLSH